MEVNQNVVHATVGGGLHPSCTSPKYTGSCDNYQHIEVYMEPTERTPLLPSGRSSTSETSSTSATVLLSPAIYTKECINWRTIGLLLMFISGLVMATYLLWQQTIAVPYNGYKLNLIRHDIWSGAYLHDIAQLEANKVVNVYITHTASEECSENCASLLHGLQRAHIGELPFNFLLAGDCETYEARGWQYVSSFTELPQSSSLVLAFVGEFSQWLPSMCQLQMAQALLWESQRRLKLQPGYQLYALRNVSRSARDADALHRQLQRWPFYAGQLEVK
ncbi:peptidoglycan-recognition protein LD [Drosophila mojavensis]|uniref:Uncharacterized protein, isoform A n=1 Tax=Drosophila mojavensis TaxID=7230 RepID=B4KXJ9_DROMO|nr:peptidoglycan-recognition protein LD [Drosophila mojavensis]EDW18685.2 uncharacterized protein Dmoj_GI13363, isoform A [Drosophila mojavensis]